MGQSNTHIQQLQSIVTKVIDDCGTNSQALIKDEMLTISYDEFLEKLSELNRISHSSLNSEGHQLVFAVKKGTDITVLWKATIQIACLNIWPETHKVVSYRLLSFREFVRIYKRLHEQCTVAAQTANAESLSQSQLSLAIADNVNAAATAETCNNECCICLERTREILLPCAHSFCLKCIEEWSQIHRTCPICREQVSDTNDTWILSDVPTSEEIRDEIRATLLELADDRATQCSQS